MDDLFAHAEARKLEGMTLAADAQERETPGFGEAAYAAIVAVAKRQPTVHIDDILTTCSLRPEHYNAWGSVWSRAIRNGIIRRSGNLRRCTVDASKHSHSYPVYESLIIKD